MLLFLLLPALILANPIERPEYEDYSDSLARNNFWAMCNMFDSSDLQGCFNKYFNNSVTLRRKVSVKCDLVPTDSCVGYSAVDTRNRAIILVFRGTVGALQLIYESIETAYDANVPWIGGGNVSKYFRDAFVDIWNGGMKDDFTYLKQRYPSYKLWVIGHSLGGALASLCSSYVVANGLFASVDMMSYTFGQPRVGDANYANWHDTIVKTAYRVTHYKDPVPHLPLLNMEGYRHHKAEVYYLEDMSVGQSYTVCDDVQESKLCSDKNVIDANLNDHGSYFNYVPNCP